MYLVLCKVAQNKTLRDVVLLLYISKYFVLCFQIFLVSSKSSYTCRLIFVHNVVEIIDNTVM